ncbi:MAG: leucyl aminopeptidase [Candidatus Moraniibacteriota bacterium]
MQIRTIQKAPRGTVLIRLTEDEGKPEVIIEKGHRIIELGRGKLEKMTRRKLILLMRRMVMVAKERQAKTIALHFTDFSPAHLKMNAREVAELIATNALMANFDFTHFKTKPKGGFPRVEKLFILGAPVAEVNAGLREGKIIGEEVNRARHIATMPGSELTPESLAHHAKEAVKDLPVVVSILGEKEMTELSMGGILAVGKGSQAKPRFIVMEYWGADKKKKPVVLVGKGVTFDTGGINLKPSDYILGMNMDMSGGASAIHTLAACVRLGVKQNIIVLVPAAENMLSGESYRPGDIIRSMSGKTIEVQNTDAEGRIILADALTYARRYAPGLVIDIATLTGAAVVALGERAAALFTKDETLEGKLRHIGEEVGDFVWPLPLWDEYDDDIKGVFGDIGNVGNTKWGGAITAATFLKQFTKGYRWAHIDMAPRMTTIKGEFLEKGAGGAIVRLLVRYLMREA